MGTTQQHWENVFRQKTDDQKSWFQQYPSTSIKFIEELGLPKNASVIDVGGGDSNLVDALLEKGCSNITVLDISSIAIENVKKRLGGKASKVTWIVSDITDYNPDRQFDLWHDRAAFHFLTDEQNINTYIKTCTKAVAPNGYLVLGTFSDKGPTQCSGLSITQYSKDSMLARFKAKFEMIRCIEEDHETPSKIIQRFLFCSFRKIK